MIHSSSASTWPRPAMFLSNKTWLEKNHEQYDNFIIFEEGCTNLRLWSALNFRCEQWYDQHEVAWPDQTRNDLVPEKIQHESKE